MDKLIFSNLCRVISGEGTSVDIQIYRSRDSDWSLEVIDEAGASTVWDGLFLSDQEALDEALKRIKKDGIRSFILGAAGSGSRPH